MGRHVVLSCKSLPSWASQASVNYFTESCHGWWNWKPELKFKWKSVGLFPAKTEKRNQFYKSSKPQCSSEWEKTYFSHPWWMDEWRAALSHHRKDNREKERLLIVLYYCVVQRIIFVSRFFQDQGTKAEWSNIKIEIENVRSETSGPVLVGCWKINKKSKVIQSQNLKFTCCWHQRV